MSLDYHIDNHNLLLLRKRQQVEKNRMEGNAMAERHWERCVEGGERDHYGVFWGERVVLRRGDDV